MEIQEQCSLLEGMQNNENITHLNLKDNSIGSRGAQSFIKHLSGFKQNYLVALNLSNNMINEHLAVMLINSVNSFDKAACHT